MRVLIALDDAAVSVRAARAAAALFSGAEFLVINVASVSTAWVGGAGFGVVAPVALADVGAVDPAVDEAALLSRALEAGIPAAEPVAARGDAASEICAAAERYGVDVVVVGSHDKSALRGLFDPSVAAGVVRGTHLPVLVVSGKPPDGSGDD